MGYYATPVIIDDITRVILTCDNGFFESNRGVLLESYKAGKNDIASLTADLSDGLSIEKALVIDYSDLCSKTDNEFSDFKPYEIPCFFVFDKLAEFNLFHSNRVFSVSEFLRPLYTAWTSVKSLGVDEVTTLSAKFGSWMEF